MRARAARRDGRDRTSAFTHRGRQRAARSPTRSASTSAASPPTAARAGADAAVKRLADSLAGRPLGRRRRPAGLCQGPAQPHRRRSSICSAAPRASPQASPSCRSPRRSREEVDGYRTCARELDALVGDINGRYSESDWTPIRYVTAAIAAHDAGRLYRPRRLGLVTPLRDGMNLVAKEYVAAQDPDDPGVLILSRFAGAAEQMTRRADRQSVRRRRDRRSHAPRPGHAAGGTPGAPPGAAGAASASHRPGNSA